MYIYRNYHFPIITTNNQTNPHFLASSPTTTIIPPHLYPIAITTIPPHPPPSLPPPSLPTPIPSHPHPFPPSSLPPHHHPSPPSSLPPHHHPSPPSSPFHHHHHPSPPSSLPPHPHPFQPPPPPPSLPTLIPSTTPPHPHPLALISTIPPHPHLLSTTTTTNTLTLFSLPPSSLTYRYQHLSPLPSPIGLCCWVLLLPYTVVRASKCRLSALHTRARGGRRVRYSLTNLITLPSSPPPPWPPTAD
ncbi:hypothetical protein Pcinc_031426 [Petrolisthes cinctipes]|uniref:Uncharacterized protein n=1 Tax=Petrolisthes cinctipes TaxID=88211 RepID=A0AAE1EW37_PETCI|nr:hypothetical protein Pcinc_031426 [Petrolisthes cinctipes]